MLQHTYITMYLCQTHSGGCKHQHEQAGEHIKALVKGGQRTYPPVCVYKYNRGDVTGETKCEHFLCIFHPFVVLLHHRTNKQHHEKTPYQKVEASMTAVASMLLPLLSQ